MALAKHKVTPCLWFDTQAEEAARFYCSVFKNSKMGRISYYPDAGEAIHGKPANSVMTVEFELEGMPFLGLNGGPHFTFDEAVSFQVPCKTQDEIDYYWKALTADGGQEGPCGWLKDKYGLSWQVTPEMLPKLMKDPDPKKAVAVMQAMMQMQKIVIKDLQEAYDKG